MTGADIIGALLRDGAAASAIVPPVAIQAGRLADDVALPTLLVRVVSSIERQPLVRGVTVPTTDRVAVTVRAASYREKVYILAWVRSTCAGRTGTIAGMANVAILTAGAGPDVNGPGDSFEQTQDFRVSYDAPA